MTEIFHGNNPESMTWERVEREIARLAEKIDYTPDIIIGIIRGGMVPTRLLSNYLKVRDIDCITVGKVGKDRVVTSGITRDITGLNVLLMEDALETGWSQEVGEYFLWHKGANDVKTACLYFTDETQAEPDYSLGKVSEIPTFPWE